MNQPRKNNDVSKSSSTKHTSNKSRTPKANNKAKNTSRNGGRSTTASKTQESLACGRLGKFIRLEQRSRRGPWVLNSGCLDKANPLLMLRRVAFVDGPSSHPSAFLHYWASLRNWRESVLIDEVNTRRKAALEKLVQQTPEPIVGSDDVDDAAVLVEHRTFVIRVEFRLLLEHGSPTPHGTSASLHGTHGFPTLFGSTLKGAARAYAEQNLVARIENDQRKDETEKLHGDIERVFGSSTQMGTVVFYDAYPKSLGKDGVRFVEDVITPHHAEYYMSEKNEMPTEYSAPIPVNALSVEGGEFEVNLIGNKQDVEIAEKWLCSAVSDNGMGGKTTSGYGYFSIPSSAPTS